MARIGPLGAYLVTSVKSSRGVARNTSVVREPATVTLSALSLSLRESEFSIPHRGNQEAHIAEQRTETSTIKGYSAAVLSSAAEIQGLQPAVRRSFQQNDTLLDPGFFLASVSEGWAPRVVAVRHGGELGGVVCAKERTVCGVRLGVVYADLTFGCMLLGDSLEQQRTFLIALETLLASPATRGLRLTVRQHSPELAAVRKLLASSHLDTRFSRVKKHLSLVLPDTYEQLLLSFGSTTRRNFRYYRRRVRLQVIFIWKTYRWMSCIWRLSLSHQSARYPAGAVQSTSS